MNLIPNIASNLSDNTCSEGLVQFISTLIASSWHPFDSNDILVFNYQAGAEFYKFIRKLVINSNASPAILLFMAYYALQIEVFAANEEDKKCILVVCMILAYKVLNDQTYSNSAWSLCSEIPLHAINSCEMQVIKCLHYNLTISTENYQAWMNMIFIRWKLMLNLIVPSEYSGETGFY
jgi:hypothetical protein